MHTIDRPPDTPPRALGCVDCGGSTRSAWRRGHDGQLHQYAVCQDCGALVASIPPRKPDAERAHLDQLVRETADNLDALCARAVEVQRDLLAQWSGPTGPLPMTRARAIHAAVIAALAHLSGEHLDEQARKLAEQSGPTARFRGWHRAGRRAKWQPLVTAESEGECYDALLSAAMGGDSVVLPEGRDPNTDARPR